MENVLNIAQVIAPILAAVGLGMLARKRGLMTRQDVSGLQQFVMKFGLPCVIFNSCLTADIGAESLTSMVLVLPMYEIVQDGLYYNTAAVVDADGSYLGKYRKQHIPQVKGFWEKFYFRPGNLGWPVFETAVGTVGVGVVVVSPLQARASVMEAQSLRVLPLTVMRR